MTRQAMRVRVYAVLERAVEDGVVYGWRRAHKHDDAPEAAAVQEHVARAVLSEICDYFDVDEEEDTP